MLEQAHDYRDECAALNDLLVGLREDQWDAPTQFKNWTTNDVLGHLHLFDHAAQVTLESTGRLRELFAQLQAGRADGRTLVEVTRDWLGGCSGEALRERWFDFAMQLAGRYAAEDPSRRVAWGGPDMSVRSCISARQMETWAHGQAVFDLFGVARVEADRLCNIAIMGVNTYGWSFVNRKLPVPQPKPCVRLAAPSGTTWEWHPENTHDVVEGPAADFCRVVTQTRNIADTALEVRGATARAWMDIAQCFAGPPEDPPAPGTRYRRKVGA